MTQGNVGKPRDAATGGHAVGGHAARGDTNGDCGKQEELNKFLQAYTIEKARLEARKKGHRVSEAKREDRSIKVTVHVGSAA